MNCKDAEATKGKKRARENLCTQKHHYITRSKRYAILRHLAAPLSVPAANTIFKLKKAQYGMKAAPRLQHKTIGPGVAGLVELGWGVASMSSRTQSGSKAKR